MFNRRWIKDATERATKTFIEVFLAAIVTGNTLALDVTTYRAAALSAAAAAISVVASMVSSLRYSTESASWID